MAIEKKRVLHRNQTKYAKYKLDGDLKVHVKALLQLKNGSIFQFQNVFGCSF